MALKTNVYIDAFNLYYGCLRKTPYRWLDLGAFCSRMLTNNQINRIRYFTALVTPRVGDPQQRNRQEIYLRALRTIPNLTIHTGRYLSNKVWMMRADGSGKVEVLKSEEKRLGCKSCQLPLDRCIQKSMRCRRHHFERF